MLAVSTAILRSLTEPPWTRFFASAGFCVVCHGRSCARNEDCHPPNTSAGAPSPASANRWVATVDDFRMVSPLPKAQGVPSARAGVHPE